MFPTIRRNVFAYSVLLLLAAAAGCATAGTPVRQCANNKPLPLSVQLDDCAQLPCAVTLGSTVNMAINFVALKDSMSRIDASLHATALGIRLPYELLEERADVCRNLMFGAYCPLDAGEDVVYHMALSVSAHQMEVPTTIEVNLLDRDDGAVMACFITDLRVKKSL